MLHFSNESAILHTNNVRTRAFLCRYVDAFKFGHGESFRPKKRQIKKARGYRCLEVGVKAT